jgi:xylulokinase
MPEQVNQYVLAIDLGTSGPKAGLMTTGGEILDWEFEPVPLILQPHGGAEQDPAVWWSAILKATHRLLDKHIVPVDDIFALSCTSQWSGTVAVDRDGNPLMNAVIWLDSRGAKYVKEITKGLISVAGYDPLKLINWIRLTGGAPEHNGKSPVGHILYIKHERPEIYKETYKFLEPKDYLNYRLTGIPAASYDSISLHSLTDNRDISRINYSPSLFKALGFEPGHYPELKRSIDVLGALTPQAAGELGLSPKVQVVVGSPDVHATAIGSGAVKDYQPHLYIGTSSWISCHIPFKRTLAQASIASLPSSIPDRYLVLDEQDWAAGCLNFILEKIIYPSDELETGEQPTKAHALLNKLAESIPVGSDKVIFTPWLYGERTPADDDSVRGGFFNITPQISRAHLARSVFEGVAYNTRWLLDYVERFVRRRLDGFNMVGGGALSNLWCQITADVLDRTIHQMKDPRLVSLRGAGFLALVAFGRATFDDIAARVQIDRTYHPNPENRGIYDELYREFVNLYRATRPIYARLNKIT